LNGFEAILMYNGFPMAFVGGVIVFTGLAILALSISQIHKIISFFGTAYTKERIKKSLL